MSKLTTIGTITDEMLDHLKDKYKDDPKHRVIDDRERVSHNGYKRGYFLISKNECLTSSEDGIGYTFIWINNKLWQYNYINVHCSSSYSNYREPLELLNSLI